MAQQLVYTSASKLLDAGRSGFGTVARSKSLSPLLVSAIERVSQYANIRGTDRTRVIFVHRRIIAANNRVHVLSRIADAGADYTGRTNHIAHHLIVTQEEMTRAAAQGITPADVLMQFPWLQRWDGAARFFGPEEDASLTQLIQPRGAHASRATWAQITGNPAHARLLCWEGAPRNGVLIIPRGVDPLGALAEALAEFGAQSWTRTFTTSLETTDEMSDLDWVISSPDNFHEIEGRCGARTRLDLTQPHSLPVPPEPVKAVEAPASPQPASYPQPFILPTTQPVAETVSRVEPMAMNMGGSAGAARRAPLKVAPVKKNHSKAYGIAAAVVLLIVAAAIFFKVAKEGSSAADSINIATSTVPNEKDKEYAKKKLEDKGLSEVLAAQFVATAGNDPRELADYACMLLEFFNTENPDIKSIRKNIPKGHENIKSITWLSELKKARDKLDIDNKNGYEIQSISEIHKLINNSAKATEWNMLKEDSADKFCSPLIKSELDKIFGNNSWDYEEEKIDSIKKFAEKNLNQNNNYAYFELKKFIRQNFVKFMNSPLKNIFSSGGNAYSGSDVTDIKSAINYWDKSDKEYKAIDSKRSGLGFVPKNFEELLKTQRSKNQNTPPDDKKENPLTNKTVKGPEKPSEPNLAGVKEKEIIIVSEDEIKSGVEVEILKRLFNENTKNIPDEIQIFVDGDNINKKISLDKNGFFSNNYADADYKISRDGIISTPKGCKVTSISYKDQKLSFQTFIVVDQKSDDDKPLVEDLKLDFRDENPDAVTISGDLEKWILAANPDDIKINLDKSLILDRSSGKLVIKFRHLSDKNKLILSDKCIKNIDDAKKAYGSAQEKSKKAGTQSKIESAEEDEKKSKENLLKKIYVAIGEAQLIKDYPNLGKEIDLKNLDDARQKTKDKTERGGLSASPYVGEDKYKDNPIYKDDTYPIYKKKVDEENIDKVLKVYGEHHIESLIVGAKIKDLKNAEHLKSANTTKIDIFIQFLKKPLSASSPKININSITVSTISGRVLFTAKKQP
jgi:hypothetical protein